MRVWIFGIVSLVAVLSFADGKTDSTLEFPQIEGFGGIVRVPGAAEPARRGAQIVFDITADGKPDDLNKGLESVARYLNLNAVAGFKSKDVKLALVLHGAATKAALNDEAYAQHTPTAKNPNRELIRRLKSSGVEVFVCGQSLARNQYLPGEVADGVTIAVSAMTVSANKQQDGYTYHSIH